MKLGVEDGLTGGLEFKEGVAAAEILTRSGLDAIEISSGLRGRGYKQSEFRMGVNRPDQEGYFRDWCRNVKERVQVPVIMVGGIRSLGIAAKIIHDEIADFVSMSRPLIREPDLIARWQGGDLQPATCVSCNSCMEALLESKPFGCYYKMVSH